MSCYHKVIRYQNRSNVDYNLKIVEFDVNHGATTAFLGMENVFDANRFGTDRWDYGAKFKETTQIKITMIKVDDSDFTQNEFRAVCKWLSGWQKNSWLDCVKGCNTSTINSNDIDYSYMCKCIDLQQYKLDGRTIGIVALFDATSPWAYSAEKVVNPNNLPMVSAGNDTYAEQTINNDNPSTYIFPNVDITVNQTIDELQIIYGANGMLDNVIELKNVHSGEHIIMAPNQIITSDNPSHTSFGDDFNYNWIKLQDGKMGFKIVPSGAANVTLTYREPRKVGDFAIDTGIDI